MYVVLTFIEQSISNRILAQIGLCFIQVDSNYSKDHRIGNMTIEKGGVVVFDPEYPC